MHRFALTITLAFSAATTAFAQTPPSASAFGRLPAVQDAEISPNGRNIAILGGGAAERRVTIATFDTPGLRQLALGEVATVDVNWASDDYALVKVSIWDDSPLHTTYHLYRNIVIDTDAKPLTQMLKGTVGEYSTDHAVVGVVEGPKAQAMVIATDWNRRDPNSFNSRLKNAEHDNDLIWALWRVDLKSGRATVEERTTNTYSWAVDGSGEARVRWDNDPTDGTERVFVRAKGASAWRLLDESREGAQPFNFLGYSDAEDAVYLTRTKDGGRSAVMRRRLADDVEEEVAAVEGSPDLLWDPHLRRPLAATNSFGDQHSTWFDPEIQSVNSVFAKVFKGKKVQLASWSRDRTRFLARISGPDYAPQWFLYDKARKEVSPVGEEYPELKDVALGKVSAINYPARDGLSIPAYLTLPPGAPAGAKLPLVVLPHGGPASHDKFDFDWWAQFIASRGYAVLQPQFRGSTGFGSDFEKAGEKEWGGKVQTDLLDGIAHLAKQGQIDPARVCIIGASFGGYSALAGATLHPEAYRCAASVNGISDLPGMLGETIAQAGDDAPELSYWKRVMGSASVDRDLLQSTSPVRRISAQTPPILLVVSEQDTTVMPAQSARMRDALQAARRPVVYVGLEKDDHYLMRSATRTKMLEAVGEFLATHLPVGP